MTTFSTTAPIARDLLVVGGHGALGHESREMIGAVVRYAGIEVPVGGLAGCALVRRMIDRFYDALGAGLKGHEAFFLNAILAPRIVRAMRGWMTLDNACRPTEHTLFKVSEWLDIASRVLCAADEGAIVADNDDISAILGLLRKWGYHVSIGTGSSFKGSLHEIAWTRFKASEGYRIALEDYQAWYETSKDIFNTEGHGGIARTVSSRAVDHVPSIINVGKFCDVKNMWARSSCFGHQRAANPSAFAEAQRARLAKKHAVVTASGAKRAFFGVAAPGKDDDIETQILAPARKVGRDAARLERMRQ